MNTVKYIGCFFDPEELRKHLINLERKALSEAVSSPHVTFVYSPVYVPWNLLGEEITVKAVGYGNNGENEALKIEFLELPAGLKALAAEIAVPHITLSVSENGEAVNSRDLEFNPTEPFVLTGVFGAMGRDGKIAYKATE